jgi:hypothetical protein
MGSKRQSTFLLFTKYPYHFQMFTAVLKRFSAMYEIFRVCICVGLGVYVYYSSVYVRMCVYMCVCVYLCMHAFMYVLS